MSRATIPLLLTAFAASSVGCTKERLQYPEKVTRQAVDNLVSVEANFCTAIPEDQVFPVKILLILDASGSLQFLDEGGLRVAAIRALLDRYDGDPSVLFSIIQFNSLLYQAPPSGAFVPAAQLNISDTQLQIAEILTDYQAALSRALSTLEADMRGNPQVGVTKYVVIFFSDGSPSPVCCPCEEETAGPPPNMQGFFCDPVTGVPSPPPATTTVGSIVYEERYCEGTQEIPFCNLEIDRMDPNLGRVVNAYTGLQTNGSYNRAYQIEQLMRDIVDTANTYDVGQFQFHTVLLNNPTLPAAIAQIVGFDYPTASARMQSMATIGGGAYVEARNIRELDFLQFDYTAIKSSFGLRRVFLTNLNAVPGREGPRVDSDGDGIADAEESTVGSNMLRRDTDGDGYSDLVEIRFANRGMNVLDPNIPYQPCNGPTDRLDDDRDLLVNCEEAFFGTRVDRADSDNDTIPDGLEVRFGLDPTKVDSDLDYDFDGVPNGEEVKRNTDPRLDDPEARNHASYRYTLQDLGGTLDNRRCFHMTGRNVQLMNTQGRDGVTQPGWNDILMWEMESPENAGTGDTRVRVACFRGRYIPPDYKQPVDGTYPVLRDEELRDVLSPQALDKCWGPQLPVMP